MQIDSIKGNDSFIRPCYLRIFLSASACAEKTYFNLVRKCYTEVRGFPMHGKYML